MSSKIISNRYIKPSHQEKLNGWLTLSIWRLKMDARMATLDSHNWIHVTKPLYGMIQPGTSILLIQITNFLFVRDFIVSFKAGLLLQKLLRLSVELESQLMNKPWLKLRSPLEFAPTPLNTNEKRKLEELEAHIKKYKDQLLTPFAPKPEPAPTAAVDGNISLTESTPEVEVPTGLKPRQGCKLEAAWGIPIEPVVIGLPVGYPTLFTPAVARTVDRQADAGPAPVVTGLPVVGMDTEENAVVTVPGTPI